MLQRTHTAGILAPLLAVALIGCGSSPHSTVGTNTVNNNSGSTTAQLSALAVTPAGVSIPIGISARFTATGTYSDGSTKDLSESVTWSAADPSCASARADIPGVFDTHGACTTTVTAKDASTGLVATSSLTGLSAVLQSIAIAPINPTLLVGTTTKLSVSGLLSDGSSADLTFIKWQSADSTVAFVGSDGTVLAVKEGAAVITATEPITGFSDTTTVTVTVVPGVLSYLSLSPGSVIGGGTRTVLGTVALDSPATADKTITLTSSSGAAVVNPASVVIAAGSSTGTFQVTTTAVDHRTKVTITAASSDPRDVAKTASLNVRVAH